MEITVEPELLVGMDGPQAPELWPAVHGGRRPAVHRGDSGEGWTLAATGRPAYVAGDLVTGPEPVLSHQLLSHVHIALDGSVSGLPPAHETGALGRELEDA